MESEGKGNAFLERDNMSRKNYNTNSLDNHLIAQENKSERLRIVERLRPLLDDRDLTSGQGKLNRESEVSDARKLRLAGKVQKHIPPVIYATVDEDRSFEVNKEKLHVWANKRKR